MLLAVEAKIHEGNSFILFVVDTGIGENCKRVVVKADLGIIFSRTMNEDGDRGRYKFS